MEEETLFIIKPDGFKERNEIKSEILRNFRFVQAQIFRFYPGLLARLYPQDVGKEHYSALVDYMMQSDCEVGIILGESAIERFFEFSGRYSDPRECDEHTIRYRYGRGLATTRVGLPIIMNAIHRVKSKKELDYELSLFRTEGILL